MELIDQHSKGIMEGCKERAPAAGLRFADASLAYIVTNRDLLELSPPLIIPTLYDYSVHDAAVLREKLKISPEEIEARNAVARRYSQGLGDLVGVPKAMSPASLKSSTVTRGTSFCASLPAAISAFEFTRDSGMSSGTRRRTD